MAVTEQIERAFRQLAARVAGGAHLALVTVRQIDPDSGATLATAENVTALKRSRRRQMFGVQLGELGSDQSRFVLLASAVGFFVKTKDEIEADGVTWHVDTASAIAFDVLYACDVGLRRS